jgi:spore coat polysaccharide biosynthesis protein SpsF
MSSTRLPGKTLADVCGEPMLALLVARLRRARSLDGIVIATSDDASDDPIAALDLGVPVVRGSLTDVLGRFVVAVGDHPGPIVRITADCPFIDPETVDRVVGRFETGYVSNVEPGPRTFPKGLDTEVFSRDALLEAAREATTDVEREHVTPYIRSHNPTATLTDERDLGDLRWTVDLPEDLAFVRAVAERLGERRSEAGIDEILAAVRAEPSLAANGLRG